MRIAKLRLANFRSFLDRTVTFEPLTAIVGPNGAGKSTVLHALAEFYNTSQGVNPQDHYDRDASVPIEIAITFTDLTDRELEVFAPYLNGSQLTVTKIIDAQGARYHGTRPMNADFAEVRAAGSKSDQVSEYRKLQSDPRYAKLPNVRSADAAHAALTEWESLNPEALTPLLDDGRFFAQRHKARQSITETGHQ